MIESVHVKETRLSQMSMVLAQSRMNVGCTMDLVLGAIRMSGVAAEGYQ